MKRFVVMRYHLHDAPELKDKEMLEVVLASDADKLHAALHDIACDLRAERGMVDPLTVLKHHEVLLAAEREG